MSGSCPPVKRVLQTLALLAFVVGVMEMSGIAQSARKPHRIAILGSSVAFGNGDETGNGGYTADLKALFATRGWEVLNVSRGGDNTGSAARRIDPPAPAPGETATGGGQGGRGGQGGGGGAAAGGAAAGSGGGAASGGAAAAGGGGGAARGGGGGGGAAAGGGGRGGALPGYATAAPRSPADSGFLMAGNVNAGYVVIGLSVANELIWEVRTKEEKDKIYEQYATGMKGLIATARAKNITPVIALCYPRLVYTDVEYNYMKRMNILQNTWDVPSVNLLGTLDNGRGQWAQGFGADDKHPNSAGHAEFATAFVPTLFEALEKGKTTPVRAEANKGFARITDGAALTFTPEWAVHSFAVNMMVRAQGDGAVAAISGNTLGITSEHKKAFVQGANVGFDEFWVAPDQPFTSVIGVDKGMWIYKSSNNGLTIQTTVAADANWHQITLSHYMARGETILFIDGKFAGSIYERLNPKSFVIGGPGDAKDAKAVTQGDYKDVFIYRAALNQDEVAVLNGGKMIQASMEVYAPLTDAAFKKDGAVENRAQSLAELKVGAGTIAHATEMKK